MAYKSMYAENKMVNAPQYLCEIVCKNRADKMGMELPLNFWRIKLWGSYYIVQMKFASALMKQYEGNENELISFVKASRVWSLKPAWIKTSFEAFLKESNKKNDKEFSKVETVKNPTFQKTKNININYLD